MLDGDGISQISESSYKSATTTTSTSTDIGELDDQQTAHLMEQYVKKQEIVISILNFFRKSKLKLL